MINEIDIFKFLELYKNRKIICIVNPGNAGDCHIANGTFKVFDKIGLDYSLSPNPPKYNYENKLLFYAGGGNLIGLYTDCRKFLKRNSKKNEKFG